MALFAWYAPAMPRARVKLSNTNETELVPARSGESIEVLGYEVAEGDGDGDGDVAFASEAVGDGDGDEVYNVSLGANTTVVYPAAPSALFETAASQRLTVTGRATTAITCTYRYVVR